MELSTARAQAVLKLFPAINLFTLFDTVLLLVYFWTDVEQSLLLGWALWSLVHCVFWWGYAARTLDRVSAATPRTLIVHALSEGLLFAVLMVLVFPLILPEKAVVLGAFATGMMAAGALSKMTLPAASLTFVGILTGGTSLSLTLSPLPQVWVPIVLLTTFGVALSVLALAMSRNFDGRVLAEREVERQKTMVSLLLQDFEESASEGLWEADPQGRLTYVSPRLTELLGVELQGRQEWVPFLRSGKAFRHQVVAAEVGGQRRWWSLTGKPLTDESGTVTGWRGVGSDITGARELELEAIRLSRFDNLTGLLNRHAFRQLLDTFFEAGSPTDRTLVLIDLVGFRGINESRGHQFGDELLQAVARRLQAEVEDSWTLARLDGDEFALQWETHGLPTQTQATLKALLLALIQPYTIGKDRFEVAFRLGTARAPVDATSAELWLRCANLALRSSKGDGRTSLVSFTPDAVGRRPERADGGVSAVDRPQARAGRRL